MDLGGTLTDDDHLCRRHGDRLDRIEDGRGGSSDGVVESHHLVLVVWVDKPEATEVLFIDCQGICQSQLEGLEVEDEVLNVVGVFA